ncbi:MAG: GNAT family N-acetyltransferase [Blastocatellia bacterium]
MTEDCHIRRATVADAAVIAHQRARMFYDLGRVSDQEAAAIETETRRQMNELLESEEYLAWLAECDGKIVAGGGVMMRRLLPRPGAVQGAEEAYILNVYTEPEYRRRGVARKLMETIIAWARERGCERVTLHPSEDGRALYESLGFDPTDEMRLRQD